MSISIEEMRAITRDFIVEPWEKGNLDILDELCSPNYRLEGDVDLETFKGTIARFRNALPDLKVSLGEIIAEGDLVAYRWTMEGTHLGEYQGIAPTNKPVTLTGITIIRFEDGKIIHDQFQSSSASLEEQVS